MSTFGSYAPYYDLLYSEKAYEEEAAFVMSELGKFAGAITRLLDLGCGTGVHALRFAAAGYRVRGVDTSSDMLELAQGRRSRVPGEIAARLEFDRADIRRLRLREQFDAAVSLFHVMSYQTANQDVEASIAAVRRHLAAGSPFLFDFWHAPAVIASGPSARKKEVENESVRVIRVATPTWSKGANRVDVHYRFSIQNKSSGESREFEETHAMRYFFPAELEQMLSDGGFRVARCAEWLTGREPNAESFSAYIVAIAV